MKQKNRFDLEQEMLSAWRFTEDMQVLCDSWESLNDEQKLNIIKGMIDLYQIKFDMMFNTFEKCIRAREFKRIPEMDDMNSDSDSSFSNLTQGNIP